VQHQEQLDWEARVGRLVAFAAFGSAALALAGAVIQNSALGKASSDSVDFMYLVHSHRGALIGSTVLSVIGTMLIAPALWFLYMAAKYRRPQIPSVTRVLIVAIPIGAAFQLVRQIQIAHVADRVHAHLTANPLPPFAADDYVKHQFSGSPYQIVGALGVALGLAIAFAFVLIGINAMRAGLLSRFMGYMGVAAGVLIVLPLGFGPVVQVFWLGALGLLFLGRWPQGGRGPAWETGEADPWPTASDRQAEIAERRAERDADREGTGARSRTPVAAGRAGRASADGDEPDEDDLDDEPAQTRAQPHPRSKKRKRKRR
jgi:hypothetical protein